MAYDFEKNVKTRVDSAEIDLGLKAYMNKVYSFMAFGLALTGALAHLTANLAFDFSTNTMTSFGAAIYASPLAFIIMLSPLAFIIALNFGVAKMKESTVQILFWAFAAVMGISLSSILAKNIPMNAVAKIRATVLKAPIFWPILIITYISIAGTAIKKSNIV